MTAKLGAERTMRQKPNFKNVVGRLLPIQRPFFLHRKYFYNGFIRHAESFNLFPLL